MTVSNDLFNYSFEHQSMINLESNGLNGINGMNGGGWEGEKNHIDLAAQFAMEAFKESIFEQEIISSMPMPLQLSQGWLEQSALMSSLMSDNIPMSMSSMMPSLSSSAANITANANASSFGALRESDIPYIFKDGRYECPRDGCRKLYKNRNGLKYHLVKGQCQGSMDIIGPDGNMVSHSPGDAPYSTPSSPGANSAREKPARVDFSTDPEGYKRFKPFFCLVCEKRYKNVNGLKYHGRVEHKELDFERFVKGV